MTDLAPEITEAAARWRGRRVHVGQVNSLRRLRMAWDRRRRFGGREQFATWSGTYGL